MVQIWVIYRQYCIGFWGTWYDTPIILIDIGANIVDIDGSW